MLSEYKLPLMDYEKKSISLFEKRGVYSLARLVLCPEKFNLWLKHALKVQTAIYVVDNHFENTEHILSLDLCHMWNEVENALSSGEMKPIDRCWSSLKKLRDYEKIEQRIHEKDVINPREYERIVSLKTSDVSISRALIWSYKTCMSNGQEQDYWSLFDECGELIEDIQDLSEDGTDWNFNFWLYTFMAGSSVLPGAFAACKILQKKLCELEIAYSKLAPSSTKLIGSEYAMITKEAIWVLDKGWLNSLCAVKNQVQRFSELEVKSKNPIIGTNDQNWSMLNKSLSPKHVLEIL